MIESRSVLTVWCIATCCMIASVNVCYGAGNPHCGPQCLYTAMTAIDVNVGEYADFLQTFGLIEARGTSLIPLADMAEQHGLQTLLVKTTLDNLRTRGQNARFACVAHLDGNHFVLIGDVQENRVWIVDPPAETEVASAALLARWKGHALLLAKEPLVREEDLPSPTRMWTIWTAGGFAFSLIVTALFIRHRRS